MQYDDNEPINLEDFSLLRIAKGGALFLTFTMAATALAGHTPAVPALCGTGAYFLCALAQAIVPAPEHKKRLPKLRTRIAAALVPSASMRLL